MLKSYGTGLNKNLLFSLQVSLSRTTRWRETKVSPLLPREPYARRARPAVTCQLCSSLSPPSRAICCFCIPLHSSFFWVLQKCLCASTLYLSFMLSFLYFRVHSLRFLQWKRFHFCAIFLRLHLMRNTHNPHTLNGAGKLELYKYVPLSPLRILRGQRCRQIKENKLTPTSLIRI